MIIDASVTTAWYVNHPLSHSASKYQQSAFILLPAICVVETANAIWTYVRIGGAELTDLLGAVQSLIQSADEIVDDYTLLESACRLAAANNHPIYDCIYLALARERNMPLATADKKLAKLAKKLSIKTELIRPST